MAFSVCVRFSGYGTVR
ncbi:hypothetical protein LZU85_19870 [Vibrio sp. IRLE0018]|nr:hypothetical protein [Vibrio vulnificus]MCF8781064.1 hypothetical protein [Vibrio floridensis]MDF4403449.1 hypothetical protein [Vibrio parahaemolyticus]MCU8373972.1 hypothetical protein [Vibrio vulnificus]MCU8523147.1 hypothetical protein [Vibrio vulnificus]MCU8557920.1 hypothetical protein [Vibrio vulnificus]